MSKHLLDFARLDVMFLTFRSGQMVKMDLKNHAAKIMLTAKSTINQLQAKLDHFYQFMFFKSHKGFHYIEYLLLLEG